MYVDLAAAGGLALPLLAAHLLADHPLQPPAWAEDKGRCCPAGRIACAKHTTMVLALQALAVAAAITASRIGRRRLARVSAVA